MTTDEKRARDVAVLIQQALEAKGWSVRQAAIRCGITSQHLNNMANATANSSRGYMVQFAPEMIDKIARGLDIPVAELRLAAGLAPPEPVDTSAIAHIQACLLELTPANLHTIALLARALLLDQKQSESIPPRPAEAGANVIPLK